MEHSQLCSRLRFDRVEHRADRLFFGSRLGGPRIRPRSCRLPVCSPSASCAACPCRGEDGRHEEGERLREEESADDGQAERRLDSAPAPKPRAIGSVPISAAMVVIMIGRKRTTQAS